MGTYGITERRSVKLNEELYQKIKDYADDQGTWIGNLIDKAVEQYINRRIARTKKVEV